MNNPIKSMIALSASCLAGALVATVVLLVGLPGADHAAADQATDGTHHHMGAMPIEGTASPAAEATFYTETAGVNARMHAAMEVAPSGDPDRDFVRMMIPHHQGAIDMALVFLKYGHDEKLRRLAQSIIVEQGQEITYMRTLYDIPPAEPSTVHPMNEH